MILVHRPTEAEVDMEVTVAIVAMVAVVDVVDMVVEAGEAVFIPKVVVID